MKQLLIKPEIHSFQNFQEFAAEFQLNSKDIILTNEYIYRPSIEACGLDCKLIFQEQFGSGEPSDVMIEKIIEAAADTEYSRVIAVGGGTIIDIAKVLILEGASDVNALYEQKELKKVKELLIVPTTCGTGSEVTNLSIINRTRLGRSHSPSSGGNAGTKMGLGSPSMYADYAILIPEFMDTLPYYVFATSSIDALIHATESYLSPKCTAFTELFSVAAIQAIIKGYCRIAAEGKDSRKKDSEAYLTASTYAGIAFGNAGCAAVHAISYALGGKYHVPHGESNYQFFTDVLKLYQKKAPAGKIQSLSALYETIMKENHFADSSDQADGIELLERLLVQILDKKALRLYGTVQEDIHEFAVSTVENQQRLLGNNYVPLTLEEIEAIYQARL